MDHEVEFVLCSDFFVDSHYAEQSGTSLTGTRAARHFLEHGEAAGRSPSPEFDPALYAVTNPDVVANGDSLLIHYLVFGRKEGRYATRSALRHDADLVHEALGNDLEFDGNIAVIDSGGLDPLEAHLAYGWRQGSRVLPDFDDLHYHAIYPDVGVSGHPPLVHFVLIGKEELRLASRETIDHAARNIEDHFDEPFYLKQGDIHPYLTPIQDYVTSGQRNGRWPNREFDPHFYLRRYPDLKRKKLDPFLHFVEYGKEEGRIGHADFLGMLRRGEKIVDLKKPTILIALHECSRTGAPLLGLDLGREFSQTCNVVFATPREGPIYPDLLTQSCFVVVGHYDADYRRLLTNLQKDLNLKGVIANSIETVGIMSHASVIGIPVVALVHEFAESTLPHSKSPAAVEAADIVVVPSGLVQESIRKMILRMAQIQTTNLRVRHQGKLAGVGASKDKSLSVEAVRRLIGAEDPRTKIVLGAGLVQVRKGVDLFVQTAAELRRLYGEDFRFVWVGDGFDPAKNWESVWLQTTVEKLGLEKLVRFVPHQPSLAPFIEVSDLFYLSSRLDPFPNVVVDAMAQGRRIVAFEDAGGVSEWITQGRLDGACVEYASVAMAAQAIVELFGEASDSETNRQAVDQNFSMTDYATDLSGFMDEATIAARARVQDIDDIRVAGVFDEVFHNGGAPDPEDALALYAARASKGAVVWNPRPGFSDGLYRAKNGLLGAPQIPLKHAIASGDLNPATHRCLLLSENPRPAPTMKIAVHLHLHYTDMAEAFCERITQAFETCDVFVTVNTDKGRREAEFAFRNYTSGEVLVEMFANRGRDIGPMLDVLERHQIAERYEIFGHFHGKKTVDAPEGVGDLWREFLLDTLLGDRKPVTHLIELFEKDDKLGLVFAEDRFGIGWTENIPAAEELAGRMTPQPEIDPWPVFPVGTMFWARTAALAPLVSAQLTEVDFPPEPLPADGSILHALERLLPAVTRAAGLTWCTVRRRGVHRLS